MLLSALAVTQMVNLGANVTVLGGSGEQSVNVHRYISDAWRQPHAPRSLLSSDPTKREITLTMGNTCRALMASQTSVRGPHPERLLLDEVDEMEKAIFTAALGQPISRGNVTSFTVISSTLQYPNKTMAYALALAKAKHWPIHVWCWRENLEQFGGWLTKREAKRTRSRIPIDMWENEYNLNEPSPGGRAIRTEAVDLMYDEALGFYAGEDGEYIELESPVLGAPYYTGADWAKDQDNTEIATWRPVDEREELWQLVAWERLSKQPWPAMIARLNARLARFGGFCFHDATGLGKVVEDYLVIPEGVTVEGIWLAGQERAITFSSYVVAIERGQFKGPRIDTAYKDHKFATSEDLYSTSKHTPDSFVAGALAWKARTLNKSGGAVRSFNPKQISPEQRRAANALRRSHLFKEPVPYDPRYDGPPPLEGESK